MKRAHAPPPRIAKKPAPRKKRPIVITKEDRNEDDSDDTSEIDSHDKSDNSIRSEDSSKQVRLSERNEADNENSITDGPAEEVTIGDTQGLHYVKTNTGKKLILHNGRTYTLASINRNTGFMNWRCSRPPAGGKSGICEGKVTTFGDAIYRDNHSYKHSCGPILNYRLE